MNCNKMILMIILLCGNGVSASTSKTKVAPRIYGGRPVDIIDYPHQVSIQFSGTHYCGGSILTHYFILTAAHCTFGHSASILKVRVGSSTKDSGGHVIGVDKIFEHPNYENSTLAYDIAILDLKDYITFTDYAQAVRLAGRNDKLPPPGTVGTITGWGITEDGSYSPYLKAADLTLVSLELCKNIYYNSKIDETVFCAGVPQGGIDACTGDSGGGFLISGILYGIVSWGHGCGKQKYPGVYTSINKMSNFIGKTTGFK